MDVNGIGKLTTSHTNVIVPKLRWPSAPLPVGEGKLMNKLSGHPLVKLPEVTASWPFEYRREISV